MKFHSRPAWRAVAAASMVMSIVAACGSDSDSSTTEPGGSAVGTPTAIAANAQPTLTTAGSAGNESLDAPDKLVLGAGGKWGFISYSALLAARGQGYFDEVAEKFRTKIEFVDMGAGADSIAALAGGTVDGGIVDMAAFSRAVAAGQPYVGTFQVFARVSTVLIGRKEFEADRGKNVAAYADSVWGYPVPGTATEFSAKYAAQDAGLDFSKLKQIAFGEVAAAQPGMQQGRLDIVCVDVLTAARIIEGGDGYLVWGDNPLGYDNSLVFPKEFIAKYPALVQALVDASVRGLNDVKSHSSNPASVLALFPPDFQNSMKGSFDLAFSLGLSMFTGDGGYTAERTKATIEYLVTNGIMSEADAQRSTQGWDNTFVHASPDFRATS